MTSILALETSTSACSVAISKDGQMDEDFVLAPQDHTQRLLPMVDRLLGRRDLSLHSLDAIAFAHGPGSFTGLRICVGVVQGLAFGAELPVIGVSTLETLVVTAQRQLELEEGTLVAPALDARMEEIYWGLYRSSAAGERPEILVPDQVGAPEDLLVELEAHGSDVPRVIGSACPLLDSERLSALGARLYPDIHPHAQDVARIAGHLWRAGDVKSALQASPVYVRNKVSWTKRRRIRS